MSKIGKIKWFFAVFHRNEAFMLDNTHFQAVLMFSGQNIGLFGHFGQKLKKMKIWPKCGKISKNLDFFYYIIIGIRIAFQRGVNHFSIFFLSRDIEFIPNFSHLGTQCHCALTARINSKFKFRKSVQIRLFLSKQACFYAK